MGKAQTKKDTFRLKEKHLVQFSAGGVVYRKLAISNSQLAIFEPRILWLATKSSPSKEYPKAVWRLPKGWLDDTNSGKDPGKLGSGKIKASELQIQEAAQREVKEEAGIEAKIIQKVGTEKVFYFNKNKERILKFVTFYLMEWISDVKEGPGFETSEVAWLPFDEAFERLTHRGEKEILKKAKAILDSGVQQSLI